MDEPLGKSQVIPYINLISQFSEVHLISFEKKKLTNSEKSLIVSKRYWTSTIKQPSFFNKLNALVVISSKPSAWANTLEAVIISALPYLVSISSTAEEVKYLLSKLNEIFFNSYKLYI